MSRIAFVSRLSKLLTPLLLVATAGAAQASTYYVGSFGTDVSYAGNYPTNPFATIQYAINAASSGDTIYVLADTYTGAGNKDLDFGGRNITLEALPYYGTATTVTIDCQGSGRGFYFHNGETAAAVVDSFNVINGNPGIYAYGGGAYIDSSSPTFIDTTFASGKAYVGGAVFTYSASPTFNGVTFSKNTASDAGGAVYQSSYSYPIYTHCKFTTNKATYYGGAVYVYYGSGVFYNDTFTGNTAPYGGAFYNYHNSYPGVYGGTISGNKATYGGAFYNEDHASPYYYSTVISGNSAQYGGAFYNDYYSSPEVTNTTITGNTATSSGGAFYNNNNSDPYLIYNILWNNKVGLADSEIVDTDSTSVPYMYDNDIQSGWSGSNLNTDPKFVSTTDFHLQSISPLIDVGSTYGYTINDHDGNPRVCNGYTDLGAYERALPTAYNDSYSMSANTTLTVSAANGVLANDLANKGGTLSAVFVSKTAYCTVTLSANGSFVFKPSLGFTGTQSFTYKAKNTKGYSSLATVTITIS